MEKILAIVIIGALVLSGPTAFAIQLDNNDNEKEESINIKNGPFPNPPIYDLVIIAPSVFFDDLQPLIKHKKDTGIKTILKTTEEIYDEFEGRDKPEQIKYFIKYALDEWNVSYVLLVGGLKSRLWAIPRENQNYGSKHWYLPVRYTNMFDNPKYPLLTINDEHSQDPGVISDLYYADIYDSFRNFSSWDTNNDGVFAAMNHPDKNITDDLGIDLEPDVAVGRLACMSRREVKIVVNKIIQYETETYGKEWFNKIMVFSGDGFLDQQPLDFIWDTKGLKDGKYKIEAQAVGSDGFGGQIDTVTVTLNKSVKTSITHNHDEHLRINEYPSKAVVEITNPTTGDILGNTDFEADPVKDLGYRNAYDNEFTGWANITYVDEVMYIRGKTYHPAPYGVKTDVHVVIYNEEGETVYDEWKYGFECYAEGEWVTGEKLLKGRGGALYYMPETFEKDIYWASNGRLKNTKDVVEALSQGCGFAFFSGHGSPNVWADHLPGIPGDRANGSFDGLYVAGLQPYPKFINFPVFPMYKLKNKEKLPIVVVGGCHNSQFNISLIPSIMSYPKILFGKDTKMWTYGAPITECFNWRLISLPNRGAIATIGNTGLGYGRVGNDSTNGGGDAWISIEFFKQYGTNGHTILGDTFSETIRSYILTFKPDMDVLEEGHAKTVQQWVLLGDPSLRIGGIPPS